MSKRDDISTELRNMHSVLADMPRTMPYSVPEGYFEHFTDSVQNTIENIDKPEQVPGWGKKMPFALPGNYFNELTGNIVAGALAADVTSALPGKLPYAVPAGYFEALPAQMLATAKAGTPARKETKVIPLKKQFTFRQLRWAAAAVLILSIGIGSYNIFNKSLSDPEKMLATVPASEIHDYLQQHTDRIDVDRVFNADINNLQLDSKDIIQYLDETGWD